MKAASQKPVSALEEKAAKRRLKDEIMRACADIRAYFDARSGRVMALTDDSPFSALLRGTIRTIGSKSADIVMVTQDRELFLKETAKAVKEGVSPFFIIEESFKSGVNNADILRKVISGWPAFPVFSATSSQDQALYAYLMETGAKGLVLKPADSNSLILSLASGVREKSPEEKLIDKSLELSSGGRSDEALRIAAVVVKSRPENARGYLAYGDACAAAGDSGRAKIAWEMAHARDSQMLAPMGRLSERARIEGDIKSELMWLARMDRISPLNGVRKADLADACIRAGRLEAAGNYIDQAWRRVDDGLRERLRGLSEEMARLSKGSDPAMAEKYLRKSLSEKKGRYDLSDMALFNLLGLVLRRQGKSADAIKEYRQALKIDPKSPELLYNLAMAMAENYDRAGACAVMGRALKESGKILKSGNHAARNMAFIFMSQQDWKNAEICLEAALDASPDDPEMENLLRRVKKHLEREG